MKSTGAGWTRARAIVNVVCFAWLALAAAAVFLCWPWPAALMATGLLLVLLGLCRGWVNDD